MVLTTETLIHFVGGGIGGTMGAIATCPLEVVKTRLQSSNSGFGNFAQTDSSAGSRSMPAKSHITTSSSAIRKMVLNRVAFEPTYSSLASRWCSARALHLSSPFKASLGVYRCLKFIYVTEGPLGLFKGLGPNLMGVIPSRAIYFWTYSTVKTNVNAYLPESNRDTPFVHVVAAFSSGFCSSSLTNPIWLIKTRLQLDRSSGASTLTVRKCVRKIYSEWGIRGFWRGVTASYYGISETVIHFVVYEYLKKSFANYRNLHSHDKTYIDFIGYMGCGAASRICATSLAYPHEVARTRLREEGSFHRGFWSCLRYVQQTEGWPGLYRGLGTQLIRQIPNTAIMMGTYELTVYLLTRWLKEREQQQF